MKLLAFTWLLLAPFWPDSDIIQNEVESVQIGNQIWMQHNLNTTTFQNGDEIPEAKSIADWVLAGELGQPAWCYFINDSTNTQIYGKLYNWYAVSDPRGLATEGWHVPSNEEWTVLIDFLGGDRVAATDLKSRYGWKENGNGKNNAGFLALPSGSRYADGSFSSLETHAYWWSSTYDGNSHAWVRGISYLNGLVKIESYMKRCGYSVRCLKDEK